MASLSCFGSSPPTPVPEAPGQVQRHGFIDRQKRTQPRQMLSCTKCRERKVKCDRIVPCSACCARGHQKECEFVVGEGNDYSPIQQSYEIRKLRAENQKLKEMLQTAGFTYSGDDGGGVGELFECKPSRSIIKTTIHRQRRFKTSERVDNIYFGSPGLATVIADFASLRIGSHSLAHTLPKGRDLYVPEDSAYPFSILWTSGNTAAEMARTLLSSHDYVFRCVDVFLRKSQACYIPHIPDEVTKREFERFLSNAESNAVKYPDMLALVFATLAIGMQISTYDQESAEWVAGSVERFRITSDVYLAASMQALRLASFMNSPTLLGIQTLVMLGPYLTNSGRFLDAFTLFGTTIRMAHSIGLHRDPKFLNPTPPLREATIRRTLWWWMLHMDQQYSVTLGRPLGISGLGDCPPPEPLTTNPTILRLEEFMDHFTILARQILASDGMMSVGRIDEFTDKLITLWDIMPEALQFNESWLRQETPLPEWPVEVMSASLFAKVQSFLILLNRQRVDRETAAATERFANGMPGPPGLPSYAHVEHPSHRAPLRGRELAVNSSIHVLHTFLFFRYRNPSVLVCWTTGQQAFNACMILLLDAWETGNQQNRWLIEQAFTVFSELETKGVHKFAKLAVQHIADWLKLLDTKREYDIHQSSLASNMQSMIDFRGDTVMGNTGMFLLDDPGLQSFVPASFQPLSWNIAGSSQFSHYPHQTTPEIPSPVVPVSEITVAPFPITAPSFMPTSTVLNVASAYAVGLQPRMPDLQPQRRQSNSVRSQMNLTQVNGGSMNASFVPSRQRKPTSQQSTSQYCNASYNFNNQTHQNRSKGSISNNQESRYPRRTDRPPRLKQRRK